MSGFAERTDERAIGSMCQSTKGEAMLESIGETNVRMTMRPESNPATDSKTTELAAVEKTVAERPIENAQESDRTEAENEETRDYKRGGYKTDDNGTFFEKYDKNGNVIYRLPPEQKPIDERA